MLGKIQDWYPELACLPAGVYAVGGVVRDALLRVEPLDADLTARAAKRIAREFASLHSTNLVELGRDPMKLFRVVVGGRVYDFVEMTGGSIEEDLLRRDFTMNALALEIRSHRLIDPLGGAADIERKCVRMVSESNLRDDPLRIVRAVRMAVKFGFEIEASTLEAMQRTAAYLSEVAVERVTYELRGILSAQAPRGAALLSTSGIDRIIFGRTLTSEDVRRLENGESSDPDVGLAILFSDRTEQEVREIGALWKMSVASVQAILAMQRVASQLRRNPDSAPIALYDSGREAAERTVAFLRGMGEKESSELLRQVIENDGERIFSLVPVLSGDEIGAVAEIAPGPELGRIKREMIEAQVRGQLVSRDDAERWLRALSRSERDVP